MGQTPSPSLDARTTRSASRVTIYQQALSDVPARGWRYLKSAQLAEACGVHATEFLFEVGDLVPEPGCQLEL
jgi:Putative DNA-binding protein N-terminus